MKIEKKAKGKGKAKAKGKAIIGIAMAAIMLASVIAAMIGGIGAYSVGGAYNIIQKDMGATVQSVLIGQDVEFFTNWGSTESDRVTIYRVKEWTVQWTKKADPGNTLTIAGDDWKKEGAFYVNYVGASTYDAQLSFSDPDMPLKLKVGTKEVSSIAVDTNLKVDIGGINLFDNDRVDLKIVGPDGQIKYDEINDQEFTNISVAELKTNFGGSPGKLATKGWTIGGYSFQVKTKSEYACGLDAASAVKDLKMLKGEIAIDADTTSTVELVQVTITVTGVAGDVIEVSSIDSKNVHFKAGIYDTPLSAKDHPWWFADTIDADGKRKYAVEFKDTGSYTITATVTGPAGNPRIGDYDDVDITVSEKGVTFDMPALAVIGDRITIKGTATSGTFVSVYIDDVLYRQLQDLVIDNGEFSKEVTTTNVGMNIPGSVRLKAWIDCNVSVPSGDSSTTEKCKPERTSDGSTNVFMVRPWLTARLSPDSVDQENKFTVEGTAPGSRQVTILCVPPKGGGGKSLLDEGVTGISLRKASVSTTDDKFTKTMTVQEDADSGVYYVIVLSVGMDDEWDMTGTSNLVEALDIRYRIPSLTEGIIHTKSQEDVVEIFEDLTQCAGSDDLMRILTIKVGEIIEKLTLNPIPDVVVGEPLEVTGNSSRKDGSIIWITVKKPYYEIAPQAAIVKDNTFNATFDTTGAQPGTYIVKANDGYGYTAVTSVNIVAEMPPAPTSFDTGEGGYPSIMGTHNGTLTIQ